MAYGAHRRSLRPATSCISSWGKTANFHPPARGEAFVECREALFHSTRSVHISVRDPSPPRPRTSSQAVTLERERRQQVVERVLPERVSSASSRANCPMRHQTPGLRNSGMRSGPRPSLGPHRYHVRRRPFGRLHRETTTDLTATDCRTAQSECTCNVLLSFQPTTERHALMPQSRGVTNTQCTQHTLDQVLPPEVCSVWSSVRV